jgi:predicted transposase YbfD/YdcC
VSTNPQTADFPEAKQFLKSRNRNLCKNAPTEGATTGENEDLTRHFVTSWSLEAKSDQAMAQMIRAHWCCESRHWQRDACWQEDKCLIRNANAACALALIRTSLQSLVHWVGRQSLPNIFEDVAHDLSLGLSWMKNRHLGR